jgi:MarR family transcriptional regulator, transcriptional regulator for hemolysin
LDGATLIPIIDKMEKDNLVVRKVDPADRRNNRIYRTEMADLKWHKMMECALNIMGISLKGISDENVKIMKNVLENICQNLRLYFDIDYDGIKKSHHGTLLVTTIKKEENIHMED